MAYNTDLEQAIYKVICDEEIFIPGFSGTSAEIISKVKPYIDPDLLIDEDFNKNVHQVLQRNNCIRNNITTRSKSEFLINHDKYYNDLIVREVV